MSSDTYPSIKLSLAAAQKAVNAGVARARDMGQPQCIAVVDDGGHLLAFARMEGARFVSIDTAIRKAVSAAASRAPTGPRGNSDQELKLAIATGGRNLALPGGIPVIVDGTCVGAVGVGSGSGEQDREVALAAVSAIAGALTRFTPP